MFTELYRIELVENVPPKQIMVYDMCKNFLITSCTWEKVSLSVVSVITKYMLLHITCVNQLLCSYVHFLIKLVNYLKIKFFLIDACFKHYLIV